MSESQSADLALMRELNEPIVLNLIRADGAMSRISTSAALGSAQGCSSMGGCTVAILARLARSGIW